MSINLHSWAYRHGPLSVQNGTVTLFSADGTPLLAGCLATVETSDGLRYSTQDSEASVEGSGAHICIKTPGTDLKPEVRWYVSIEEKAAATIAHLHVEVENTTRRALPVERIDVLVAPSGFKGIAASELQASQTGWQSWSYATPPLPLAGQPRVAPPVFGPMLPPCEAERTLMPWMTLLRAPDGGTMLLGFTSAHHQEGVLAIQPALEGHRCTASAYAEGVALPPGATLQSETLMIVSGLPEAAALDLYARELGGSMGARKPERVPTGWCSWYQFFTEVTEADILRNLDHLSRKQSTAPLDYVQIDDGYQAQVGDWLTVNDKFPSGMRYLAGRIKEAGFSAGIWLAPFIVHEGSHLFAEHPDWLVRDDLGQPVVAMWNWEGYNYALDTTHPGVDNWLRHVIGTMVHEWGYNYLKLDFIYAAALRGKRHDPSCTGVEAYRRGLETICEAAGDAFLLGCGAPFAPSVGLVDGMRIGPDVASYWLGVQTEYGFARGLHRAVRSTLAHLWMHGHLWVNDPDCLMLRERDSELTLDEVRSWTSLVAMSGGMVVLSDDMSLLEGVPEREGLLARVLPPSDRAAIALGPYVNGIATRARLDVQRPWESWQVAAIFNWGEQPQDVTFDPAEWEMPPGPYHLYDLWSGEHYGPISGVQSLGLLPQHAVRLLSVHSDMDRPQMVGSTLHLLGGPVELSGETWDGQTLTLSLDCPGRREGTLAVYVPTGFRYRDMQATGSVMNIEAQLSGNLLVIALAFEDSTAITISFTEGDPPA